MKNIVLVTNIPTPYRVPLFNELNRQMAAKGCSLHVVFGARGYRRRQFALDDATFEFSHTFLDSGTVQRADAERTTFLYSGLPAVLRKLRPDAIIVSGFSPATVKVFFHHLLHGTPYFIWNGSIVSPYRKDGFVKSTFRKLLASRAKGFIAYGSKAKAYLESIGVRSEKITIATNTVDTAFFSKETAEQRVKADNDGKSHLLSVGYLSPRKNIRQLIDVMMHIRQQRKDVVLDLVGDGEQRAELEALCIRYGLEEAVCFHGYIQKEDLPPLMAKAKLFLFQTDFDVWGLVLNEAMAAGLPVICSPNAGASADLIQENRNGFVADFSDSAKVATLVDVLLNDPNRLGQVGQAAAAFIQEHATLAISAKGFVDALSTLNLEP